MKKGDLIMLSKGHAAPSLYVLLNYLKKLPDSMLNNYLKDNSQLPAHTPSNMFLDIVAFHAGSLGHGLSLSSGIAEGMKHNFKLKKQKQLSKIYCLISDGECNEGQVWEAAQYAVKRELDNLIVMVDKNGFQAFGKNIDVLGDSTTEKKWSAFGFETYETNGHDVNKIKAVFKRVHSVKSKKPKVIIFNTVKGYGVSSIEDTLESHYIQLTKHQYEKAVFDISK